MMMSNESNDYCRWILMCGSTSFSIQYLGIWDCFQSVFRWNPLYPAWVFALDTRKSVYDCWNLRRPHTLVCLGALVNQLQLKTRHGRPVTKQLSEASPPGKSAAKNSPIYQTFGPSALLHDFASVSFALSAFFHIQPGLMWHLCPSL